MKLTCLIIDDEPLARKILEKYVSRISAIELMASFDNAIDASVYITEHNPDIIFLDIRMPEMSGLEMLKIIQHPPEVILTSAYSEYGVESYDYEVFDYLLKPIPFERFMKTITKLIDSITPTHHDEILPIDHITVKDGKKQIQVKLKDIHYIQAYGNYLKIFTKEKQFLSRMKMSVMEALLPMTHFVRIHKSYIVSLLYVEHTGGNEIILKSGKELPLSKYYKRSAKERLG
ncbi:MAG: response regulator transcription factor [Saprospiraceae bacterium]|nr:response regulator transcription factor [Saprospiraceae bacterium]